MIDQNSNYDAIVIGSGMGGLATAGLLASVANKRVLVLERHFKLGGFTHSFQRKGFEWDVGVHYIGEMYPEAMARKMMDLITSRQLDWQSMGKVVERLHFPGEVFEIPEGAKDFEQKLIERFPEEAETIKQYFRDVFKAQGWCARWFVSKQYRWPLDYLITIGSRKLSLTLTDRYMQRFRDPLLKAILCAQWPDFGSPPAESVFGIHSTVTADYFHGGYYPVGGAQKIASCCEVTIEKSGGSCRVNHEVVRILVEGGRAVGVVAKNKGKEFTFSAPIIISDAGAVTTFNRLVPAQYCIDERAQTQRLKFGTSAIILFLGLKDDPRKHGFDDANYWVFDQLDHNKPAEIAHGSSRTIDGAFLSFGSLRSPHNQKHTAQIVSFSRKEDWSKFADTKWLARGDEYLSLKEQVTERMIRFVEKQVPGIRELIEYSELSTPLTVEAFTGHPAGMIYGQACDLNRLTRDQWKIRTSLKNLLLTGSDVGTPGINGALMAAVMTAAKVLGPLGLPRIMNKAYRK